MKMTTTQPRLDVAKSRPIADALVNLCISLGQPAAIAGGFPRDLYFGVQPKDIDIVVAFNSKMPELDVCSESFHFLEVICGQVRSIFPELVVEICEAYDCVSTDRLLGVMKVKSMEGDVAIDIIVYSDNYIEGKNTVDKVIAQFDCNLNQFVIKDGRPMYWQEWSWLSELVFFPENDIDDERIAKATAYYETNVLKKEYVPWQK